MRYLAPKQLEALGFMGRIVPAAGLHFAGACALRRNQRGQILIMSVLILPILLGFSALALDAGYAFDMRKRVQAAADAGALAGAHAIEFDSSISLSAHRDIVWNDTAINGFTNGSNGVVVTVIQSPGIADGFQYDYTGDVTAVGV